MKRLHNRFQELLLQKGAREKRYISQRQAADEMGIARGTVDRYVNNDVTRYDEPIVLVMCAHLECDVSDLLFIEEVNEESGDQSPEIKTPLAVA